MLVFREGKGKHRKTLLSRQIAATNMYSQVPMCQLRIFQEADAVDPNHDLLATSFLELSAKRARFQ